LLDPLTLLAGGNYVIAGRNVGQSTTVYAGLAWIFHFAKQKSVNEKK
jgi:hypothetical protein